MQALMMALNKQKDYGMTYKLDKDLCNQRLFFAKTTSQKVLKFNYEVLLMDCIYKTNVYKMPLCIITGVTPLNTTYYVAFAVLSAETVDIIIGSWLLSRNCSFLIFRIQKLLLPMQTLVLFAPS